MEQLCIKMIAHIYIKIFGDVNFFSKIFAE
jgi:hypothetical protein